MFLKYFSFLLGLLLIPLVSYSEPIPIVYSRPIVLTNVNLSVSNGHIRLKDGNLSISNGNVNISNGWTYVNNTNLLDYVTLGGSTNGKYGDSVEITDTGIGTFTVSNKPINRTVWEFATNQCVVAGCPGGLTNTIQYIIDNEVPKYIPQGYTVYLKFTNSSDYYFSAPLVFSGFRGEGTLTITGTNTAYINRSGIGQDYSVESQPTVLDTVRYCRAYPDNIEASRGVSVTNYSTIVFSDCSLPYINLKYLRISGTCSKNGDIGSLTTYFPPIIFAFFSKRIYIEYCFVQNLPYITLGVAPFFQLSEAITLSPLVWSYFYSEVQTYHSGFYNGNPVFFAEVFSDLFAWSPAGNTTVAGLRQHHYIAQQSQKSNAEIRVPWWSLLKECGSARSPDVSSSVPTDPFQIYDSGHGAEPAIIPLNSDDNSSRAIGDRWY